MLAGFFEFDWGGRISLSLASSPPSSSLQMAELSVSTDVALAMEEVSGVTELVRVCDSQATPDPPDRSMSTSSTKSYHVRPQSRIS